VPEVEVRGQLEALRRRYPGAAEPRDEHAITPHLGEQLGLELGEGLDQVSVRGHEAPGEHRALEGGDRRVDLGAAEVDPEQVGAHAGSSRTRAGLWTSIWSTSASLTPRARSMGRKTSCR